MWGVLLAPLSGARRTTFAVTDMFPGLKIYQKMRLGRKRMSGIFNAQRTCLVAANVAILMLNESNKKLSLQQRKLTSNTAQAYGTNGQET